MELPSNVLAALKASLQNSAHEWAMTGQMEDSRVEGLVVLTSRTYQIQSQPLQLILPITAELADGVLTGMKIFFRGTSFETADAELFGLLDAMSGPSATAAANDLLAILETE